jgi:hypothetical protein
VTVRYPSDQASSAGVNDMRNFISRSITAAAACGLAVPANAAPVTLDYKLPKASVGFAVSHTITQCPKGSETPLQIDVTAGIAAVYGAGETVTLNASGNLFVDRAFKLEFYENGTLKSFNAASDGQGGKLVVSAIKLAVTAASIAAGGPAVIPTEMPAAASAPPDTLECHDRVKALISQRATATNHLQQLESRARNGETSVSLVEQITAIRAAIATLTSQLTIKGAPAFWSPSANQRTFTGTVKAGDLGAWFKPIATEVDGKVSEDRLQKYLMQAGHGQTREYTITGTSPDTGRRETADGAATDTASHDLDVTKAYRALIYREPVRVTAVMKPSQDFLAPAGMNPVEIALANQRYAATVNQLKPLIPQIGRLIAVPFDGSGMFGSRAVAATFNEAGGLTSIGYTTAGGADALAGVVDGVNTAATDLRDARVNAIKREIELLTKEDELRQLIKDEAPESQ